MLETFYDDTDMSILETLANGLHPRTAREHEEGTVTAVAQITPPMAATKWEPMSEAEADTLESFRSGLSDAFTIFHNVQWTKDGPIQLPFGEADFIIVNRSGDVLVVEQKNGTIEEADDGLFKHYGRERKDIGRQIHRTISAIRNKYSVQHDGSKLTLDYLLFCPDHRIKYLNAVGLDRSRVVDASRADHLVPIVRDILGEGQQTILGDRVRRFFDHAFDLVPDIHTRISAGERTMTRLSGGLLKTVRAIDMNPLRLRVRGTAGCGKSTVAIGFFNDALRRGRRALLVCFNHTLCRSFRAAADEGGMVDTWHGLISAFVRSRGHELDFRKDGFDPAFWLRVQELVIEEKVPEQWKFDLIVVDEGQDFEPIWFEMLGFFLRDDGDILWLEDADQRVRSSQLVPLDRFVGFKALANYRSPQSIARFLQRNLPFEFEIANPLPGLGVRLTPQADSAEQPKMVARIVADLLGMGFRQTDIVVLSLKGLASARLATETHVGNFKLDKFTGQYSDEGEQIRADGGIIFETVQRFKGRQAPAIIVTDLGERDDDKARRLLFVAATRATVRLELIAPPGPIFDRLRWQ